MDEREERAVRSRNTAGKRQNTKRTRPRGRTGEPEDIQTGRERRPASGRRRKSSRARRRQTKMLIRIIEKL